MRERLTAIGAAILLCAVVSQGQAQGAAKPLVRATMRNDVGIELLGKALIYSFSYQRMVGTSLGLEAGLGALGGSGGSSGGTTIVFVPVSAKLYLIPKDGTLYLTGGAVLVTASTSSGPLDNATDFYGDVGLGFEFRSPGGFLFRGTAYALFAGGGYFIWPAISIGYAF
jgi:hypothetical protein